MPSPVWPFPVYLNSLPNISGSYAILFFTALDFTFITRHIHNWALFPLWFSLFIPSGAISLLFSSSILGTCQPGEFVFQCHVFLPCHTVHGNSKGWFPLGLTDLNSVLSKGISRVFFRTTVQKHQFFSTQPSSHIHTWPLKNHSFAIRTFVGKVMPLLFNMLSNLA